MPNTVPTHSVLCRCTLLCVAVFLASAVVVEPGRAADHSESVSVGDVNTARVLGQASAGTEWLVNGRDFGSTHYSPLTQINDRNVHGLGLAWSVDVDSPMGMPVEPLVADGLIFVPGTLNRVFAFDANTGKLRWRFDPQLKLDRTMLGSYAARINRGIALWEGKVFIGTGDCRVLALDAASGKLLWQTPICDPVQTGITGAPRVGGGKVFIGYHGSDSGTRGSLVALEASTGQIAWRFWNVPSDPAKGFENKALAMAAKTWSGQKWWEAGGAAVWDPIVYDQKTGWVIYGTAGPSWGLKYAIKTSGDRLFSNCIIAVKADTGEYVWHYQTGQLAPANSWPENFHIIVTDLLIGGAKRHVVMTVPRWGGFILLDALSGALISWKSMSDRDAAQRSAATESDAVRSVGHNWWPMSYSHTTGLTYVPMYEYVPHEWAGCEEDCLGGRLVAWDPLKQLARWFVRQPLAFNGGVLSTAGNLVFEGQGTGEFCAYTADSGRQRWCFQTGSAIQSVPVTYRLNGRQYVLVPVGLGSGVAMFAGTKQMATEESRPGPSRLLAFALGAHNSLPPSLDRTIPAVPKPPAQTASSEVIERGKQTLEKYGCRNCHGGPLLEGRGAWKLDGAVPDLRYMPQDVHEQFVAIVLAGSRRSYGMPGFGDGILNWPGTDQMTLDEANALHAYLIELQWRAYREDQKRLAHSGR
jgi:quinohemoprotein ethanol dehydrogenase